MDKELVSEWATGNWINWVAKMRRMVNLSARFGSNRSDTQFQRLPISGRPAEGRTSKEALRMESLWPERSVAQVRQRHD